MLSVKSLARSKQQISIEMYDKVWKYAQITLNLLKFTENHRFHAISRKAAFFMDEAQFHMCHSREIVN